MASRHGGGKGDGNIFSVGINGNNYQNLVSFTGTGGSASGLNPLGSLTLSNTTLYGMTADGGADSAGNIFGVGTDGTGYQNLVSFTGTSGSASGLVPFGSLTVSNTTMYGITSENGSDADGTVFRVGTNGSSFQNILSFTGAGGPAIGYDPRSSLTLAGTTL